MEPGSDILRCIHCRYDLRGQALKARCPECGKEVWRSLHGDARLLRSEDRALDHAHLHRRNRSASVALVLFAIIGLIAFTITVQILHERGRPVDIEPMLIGSAIWNAAFFASLAFYFNARLRHAQSLQQYRAVIERLVQENPRTPSRPL